ncbi:MarR family winged helix-turn-helix transcriptional regulator [Curtobacterium ammoniigenes]|uniref:MarR family winged helix-turn-helix transcriptional regulator n=1 Tax=Curtobacterium ammoniigenes TaxID=395387 RepID=UPI00082DF328|nr:MarR family transcriptional regulator [Curtobacterium ammoniigenes]
MSSQHLPGASGFWYGASPEASAIDVLNALRRYRTAEAAAGRRAREALGVGENGLAALRILINAEHEGRKVNAKLLAERLGITAASTSALVDRLVRSGYVEREADPDDRRGIILTATGSAMREALAIIEAMDNRTVAAASDLPAAATDVIVRFLNTMTSAVDVQDQTESHDDSQSIDSPGADARGAAMRTRDSEPADR